MARFEHILFVCTNQREPGNPKSCCAAKGAAEVLDRMKALTKQHGLKGRVRVTSSGCLDCCAKGVAVAAFSEGSPAAETWYTSVTADDAEALFVAHVLRGERFEPGTANAAPVATAGSNTTMQSNSNGPKRP